MIPLVRIERYRVAGGGIVVFITNPPSGKERIFVKKSEKDEFEPMAAYLMPAKNSRDSSVVEVWEQ